MRTAQDLAPSASPAPSKHDGAGLLDDGDPPAVTVLNPDGAGPGVIVCDHAGDAVPRALNALGLPPSAFEKHIAYDIGARGLAEIVSNRLDMPTALGGYSRLVIDLNRPEDDFTSVREIYDGSVIPGNRRLDAAALEDRAALIFRPYHDAVAELIERKTRSVPHPAIVSMHTCTDFYLGERRPWHIGVLSNRDRRMADAVLARLAAHRPDLTLGDNKPYSGLDPYGYTIETHAIPAGRPNVLFEVRQDLVRDRDGQAAFGDLLAEVLAEVLADPSLFTPFRG
jgi:predicted N-formylglutamate amidohydrolase